MKLTEKFTIPNVDIIVVPFFENSELSLSSLKKSFPGIDEDFSNIKKVKKFTGKSGYHITLYLDSKKCKEIFIYGLGDNKKSLEKLKKAGGKMVKHCKTVGKKVGLLVHKDLRESSVLQALIEGMILGTYVFEEFKSAKSKNTVTEISLLNLTSKKSLLKEIPDMQKICQGIMYTRDLVNTPANFLYPNELANECKKIGKENWKIKVTVFDEKKLQKMGCKSLLAVGQGSINPPRLAIMHYKSKKKNAKTIALVGKGITFDTGGVNLKPTHGIRDMKMDMGGAGTVLGIFKILAQKCDLPVNVIGVVATAENSLSQNAIRPGDIIGSYEGKTIEVGNTDAEGRLILADALSYTRQKYKPDYMIDFATLTGACIVALGYTITAAMSTSEKLITDLKKASARTGEKVWELPLDEDVFEATKGTISDLINYTPKCSAGTILAGCFLQNFVGDTPWLHLDIAGTAWANGPSEYTLKGGTGKNVHLIWDMLSNM